MNFYVKNFTQAVLLVSLGSFILTGCEWLKPEDKKKPKQLYMHLKCRINGNLLDVTGPGNILTDTYSTSSGTGHTITLSGFFNPEQDNYRITINNPLDIVTGVEYRSVPVYNDGNYIQYDSSKTIRYQSNNLPTGIIQQFKCSFTEIKTESVKGNIEAVLYAQPSPGVLRKLTITEGEFTVQ